MLYQHPGIGCFVVFRAGVIAGNLVALQNYIGVIIPPRIRAADDACSECRAVAVTLAGVADDRIVGDPGIAVNTDPGAAGFNAVSTAAAASLFAQRRQQGPMPARSITSGR